jgi:hypothetical protein
MKVIISCFFVSKLLRTFEFATKAAYNHYTKILNQLAYAVYKMADMSQLWSVSFAHYIINIINAFIKLFYFFARLKRIRSAHNSAFIVSSMALNVS